MNKRKGTQHQELGQRDMVIRRIKDLVEKSPDLVSFFMEVLDELEPTSSQAQDD